MPVRLVVANYGAGQGGLSGNVSVLLGKGDGTFRPSVNFDAGIHPYSVVAGDFNQDGKPDLAVANAGSANISVLLGKGDGAFQSAFNYALESPPNSIVVADFNGDHAPDLVAGGAKVSLLLANSDGTFRAPFNYAAGMGAASVASVDFNRLKLLWATSTARQD
ncbi:MAG: hypothetical protein DME24_14380 [Verrucomicrobia bacterium]|nr:MAG: hypothetical protein DME24_14380 [Verrucomicrobiota bacterium]